MTTSSKIVRVEATDGTDRFDIIEDIEHAQLHLAVLDFDRRTHGSTATHKRVENEASDIMRRALEKAATRGVP